MKLVEQNTTQTTDYKVYIHVDALLLVVSIHPFTEPDLVWDFQLPNVISINTRVHKYVLVIRVWVGYFGAINLYLPQETCIESPAILGGGEVTTMAINFSHRCCSVDRTIL